MLGQLGQRNKQNQVVQTVNPTGFQPFPSSLHLYRMELSLKKMSRLLGVLPCPLPSVLPVVMWSIIFETFIYGKCISAKGAGETLIFSSYLSYQQPKPGLGPLHCCNQVPTWCYRRLWAWVPPEPFFTHNQWLCSISSLPTPATIFFF